MPIAATRCAINQLRKDGTPIAAMIATMAMPTSSSIIVMPRERMARIVNYRGQQGSLADTLKVVPSVDELYASPPAPMEICIARHCVSLV